MKYSWRRFNGYELSSRGDKRFSAFYARMPDGRSLEQHYQCDVKGYDPGGTNWRLGKGNPPVREVDLWEEYLNLWRIWAAGNQESLNDLFNKTRDSERVFSDGYATTPVNQARALSVIMNEIFVNQGE